MHEEDRCDRSTCPSAYASELSSHSRNLDFEVRRKGMQGRLGGVSTGSNSVECVWDGGVSSRGTGWGSRSGWGREGDGDDLDLFECAGVDDMDDRSVLHIHGQRCPGERAKSTHLGKGEELRVESIRTELDFASSASGTTLRCRQCCDSTRSGRGCRCGGTREVANVIDVNETIFVPSSVHDLRTADWDSP